MKTLFIAVLILAAIVVAVDCFGQHPGGYYEAVTASDDFVVGLEQISGTLPKSPASLTVLSETDCTLAFETTAWVLVDNGEDQFITANLVYVPAGVRVIVMNPGPEVRVAGAAGGYLYLQADYE